MIEDATLCLWWFVVAFLGLLESHHVYFLLVLTLINDEINRSDLPFRHMPLC
jgi:hypothetical protein